MVIMQYKPYVPQNLGELLDQLAYMMFSSPTFKDETGYFPRRNIDTAFFSLNEGLLAVREELGEERYATLKAMSDKMRALFESDPEDNTGDARSGRVLVREMDDMLKAIAKKRVRRQKKD
jgi:hypothetical protein